jgi:hypothetical protein
VQTVLQRWNLDMALRDLIGERVFPPQFCPYGLLDALDADLALSA